MLRKIFLTCFSFVLFGCSDEGVESDNQMTIPPEEKTLSGSLSGNLELYDKYNEKLNNYDEVYVKLYRDNKFIDDEVLVNDGTYSFTDLEIGDYTMVSEKKGFGTYDTIKISNSVDNDLVSPFKLLEFPSAELTTMHFDYDSGWLEHAIHVYFDDDKWQVVSYEFFFSKEPDVSFDNYQLKYLGNAGRGGDNTNTRPWDEDIIPSISKETYSFDNFSKSGFAMGDTVYIKAYAVHEKFREILAEDGEKNFEVIRHIRKNGSNTFEFVL